MRILLLGEYSNVHNLLAKGLRELGHEVTVASDGDSWKNYPRDINLARNSSGSTLDKIKFMWRLMGALPRMRGYDIVQIINPMFLEIKADRILPIYRFLRRNNSKVVMGAMGMDYYWVDSCCTTMPLRYSDFNIGSTLRHYAYGEEQKESWTKGGKAHLNKYIADDCDAIVSVLYEYWVCYHPRFPQKTHFIPLPIETNGKYRKNEDNDNNENIVNGVKEGKVTCFIGINKERNEYKGTDIMLAAARKVQQENNGSFELIEAENVPYDTYKTMINRSDLLLDQLWSYTPAMNALLAMSKGIICVGGGEQENYDILHEDTLRPIINVQPNYESVYHELTEIAEHPERIPELKRQSMEYVARHHDYRKVAKQYEKLYKQLLAKT